MGVDLQNPDRPVSAKPARKGMVTEQSPPSRIGAAGNASTSRVFASMRARLPALSCIMVGRSPASMQQTGLPSNSGPPRSKSQCSTSAASRWLAARMASAANAWPPLSLSEIGAAVTGREEEPRAASRRRSSGREVQGRRPFSTFNPPREARLRRSADSQHAQGAAGAVDDL